MHLSPVIKNMRTNYRDVKRYIVHKLNHDKYKYILKIKTEKCSVSQLKSMGVSVPEGADTFTMVHIGKRDDSKYSKRITTSGLRILMLRYAGSFRAKNSGSLKKEDFRIT